MASLYVGLCHSVRRLCDDCSALSAAVVLGPSGADCFLRSGAREDAQGLPHGLSLLPLERRAVGEVAVRVRPHAAQAQRARQGVLGTCAAWVVEPAAGAPV